jgi:NADH dehydrogenase [ubiquinone] 1 alpha subcomplex assembly factor 1
MRPPDFDTSLREPPGAVRRRRTLQRVLGTAGVVLAITSCGSAAPPESASTATATVTAPPTVGDPPATVALATTAAPEIAKTTPAPTIAQPPIAAADECRRLTDFNDGDFDDGDDNWVVVNDGVMGGRSNGAIEFTDSAMQFTGNVVTAGGGFTSVRLQLTGDELTDSGYLALRLRSDERTYGLTLEDSAQTGRRPIAHGANLTIDGPADVDGWRTVELAYDELRPSIFGQPLDAPPFNPDEAVELGIIIADGIDGRFKLEVDWIDACSSQ